MPKMPPNTAAASAIVAVERARISSIVNSSVGRSRRDAAIHLALNSDLATETALELLEKMPEETGAKFLAAMEREGVQFTSNSGAPQMSSSPDAARLEELKIGARSYNASKGVAFKREV